MRWEKRVQEPKEVGVRPLRRLKELLQLERTRSQLLVVQFKPEEKSSPRADPGGAGFGGPGPSLRGPKELRQLLQALKVLPLDRLNQLVSNKQHTVHIQEVIT